MFAYVQSNGFVQEIIEDVEGVPIEQRYPAHFIEHLVPIPEGETVTQNMVYRFETQTFEQLTEEELNQYYTTVDTPEPMSLEEKIAQLEDCIIELASAVYA